MKDIIFKTLMLKGEAGSTLVSMEKTGHAGTTDTYTITFDDGSTTDIHVENLSSVESIELTSQTDTEDTYTATLADGSTQSFSVLNHNADIESLQEELTEGIATIAASVEEQSALLNARMDTFVSLPSGSTSGDAELMDIRVGANGRTYDNAGSAVRGQISDIMSDLIDNIGEFGKNSFSTVINTTHTQAFDPIFIPLQTGQTYYLEIIASESVSVQLVETDGSNNTQSQATFTATSTKTTKTYTAKCDAVKVGLYIYKPSAVIHVDYKVYTLNGRLINDIAAARSLIVKYPFQSCDSDYFCNIDTNQHKITFGTTCRFIGNNSILTVSNNQEISYTGASGIRYVVHDGSSISVVTSLSTNHTVLFVFYAQIASDPTMCTLTKPYAVNGTIFNPYGQTNRINFDADSADKIYLQNQPDVVIDGNGYTIDLGVHLTGTVQGGYVTIPYAASSTDHIYKVCVAKTESVLADSSQLSVGYNTTLWAAYADHTKDFKLVPVTSLTDLANTNNSFFYDGTNILINITEAADEYVLADDTSSGGYAVRFANCSGIVSNLTVKYARQACCLLNNSIMTFNNCKFMYSSLDSTFTELNNSSATLNNCEAFKARYDGFGNRAGETNKSDMTLNNCHAHYCYDDGVSHHNGMFYINGGEFDHNHKGGISSPTYESVGNICNAYIHDNEQYGIYADNTADGEITTTLVNSCLFKGNDMNYYIHRYNLIGINNVYADTPSSANHIDGGTLTDY